MERWLVTNLKGFFESRWLYLRIASTIAIGSFSTLDWVSSFLLSDRDQNATGLLFWLRVSEIATSEASVSTVRGSFSLIMPRVTSASSDFKLTNEDKA